MSLLKALTFAFYLRPLILRDRRLRAAGKRQDKWYWADQLAVQWGFYVD